MYLALSNPTLFAEITTFYTKPHISTDSPADTSFKQDRQSWSFVPVFGKQFYSLKTRYTEVHIKTWPPVLSRWKKQVSGKKNK